MLPRPLLKAGLAAAVLCLLAAAVPAAAQNAPKTRTSIDRDFRSNGDIVFSGKLGKKFINGKPNPCYGKGGTARLYRTRLSDDKYMGKVDTSPISVKKNTWELKDNRPGRYLVIVSATGCKRAYKPTDGTYLFDPPNPAVPRD